MRVSISRILNLSTFFRKSAHLFYITKQILLRMTNIIVLLSSRVTVLLLMNMFTVSVLKNSKLLSNLENPLKFYSMPGNNSSSCYCVSFELPSPLKEYSFFPLLDIPSLLHEIKTRQILEPEEEVLLRDSIPTLKPIKMMYLQWYKRSMKNTLTQNGLILHCIPCQNQLQK